MTLSRFVLKNALRNKRRSTLAILSIACSLFLVMTLQTALDQVLNPPETDASVLRMAVRGKLIIQPLPIAYMDRIAKVPGVRRVMPLQWFGGYYQDPKNFFANFAIDPDKNWDIFPEFEISPEHRAALVATRDGAIVGEKLMAKYGWKIDDKVTLRGTIFPFDVDLKIVGTYRSDFFNAVYFRYDYFNDGLKQVGEVGMIRPDLVANIWIQAENREVMPEIKERVDALFRNNPIETMTETEKAFRLDFLSTLGNIKALAGSLMGVIAFTMMLVAGGTMAMTIRERTREIGILKSIGFPGRTVLGLILAEALLISLLGFVIACFGSFGLGLVEVQRATNGVVERLMATPRTFAVTLLFGVGIGFFGAIYPASRASAMTITEALRRLN